ncbi:hypothetical protein B0H13DRAFT_2311290 [Mycena leptocephala]|nr:hypothetical protein B0H13DRAFT_2311290 [Mycena leptocephala]
MAETGITFQHPALTNKVDEPVFYQLLLPEVREAPDQFLTQASSPSRFARRSSSHHVGTHSVGLGCDTSGGRNPLPDRVNMTCAQRMRETTKSHLASLRVPFSRSAGIIARSSLSYTISAAFSLPHPVLTLAFSLRHVCRPGGGRRAGSGLFGEVEELLSASCIRVPNGEDNVNTGGAGGGQIKLIPLPLTALSNFPQQQRKDAAPKQHLDTSETTLGEGSSVTPNLGIQSTPAVAGSTGRSKRPAPVASRAQRLKRAKTTLHI